MLLLTIRCCFLYFCFHPLVVQSRPIPNEDKHKDGTKKVKFDEHNMYTDPRHPFYPGIIKTSKAWKIFWKIAMRNLFSFWYRFTHRYDGYYGYPTPPYGVTGTHHQTHMTGTHAPPPYPPYGTPAPPHGVAVPYPAPGTGFPPPG